MAKWRSATSNSVQLFISYNQSPSNTPYINISKPQTAPSHPVTTILPSNKLHHVIIYKLQISFRNVQVFAFSRIHIPERQPDPETLATEMYLQ